MISAEFAGDGYQVVTTTGRLAARCVVIASGGQHRPVIPRMASRLAVLARDQLDSQALLGVAAQQTGRLREYVR